MTIGDRVASALKAAGEQAMRNSNMGQIEAYRINHVISLVEREVAAEQNRCIARIKYWFGGDNIDDRGYECVREIENGF